MAQNVALPLLLLQRPDAARVDTLLQAVGLAGLGARAPRTCAASRSITFSAVDGSRLPVGSSASTSGGECTRARAMATRCNWPPDKVRDAGAACLLATHSQAAAARADRVLRLTARGVEPA